MQPGNVLREAVVAAVMAPSTHNSQPWRFVLRGDTLELHADPARHLRIIDHDYRQQILSCGCALFNMRVAVRVLGFEPEVTCFPNPNQPLHLASMKIGAASPPSAVDNQVMIAMGRRYTNRRAFIPRPVSAEVTDRLAHVAAQHGCGLVRLTPPSRKQLADIVSRADEQQLSDDGFRAELGRWLIPYGSHRLDGIPFIEKEYGSNLPFGLMRALRSPTLGAEFGRLEHALIEGSPALLVMGTEADHSAAWLACGEALQAVLLHLTDAGLSAAYLNQALEIPALRAEVAQLAPGIVYPLMVLRVGIPSEPTHRRAPRRHVRDVLTIIG